jgi:citrate lyase beta subunit
VRTNALHVGSAAEIMEGIAAGADLLMLPNFQSIEELTQYLSLVAGRAKVVPLVERRVALVLISEFPALGIEEFHFGLNDLALDFGVSDRLSLLLHPEIEAACKRARLAGLRFGIGGVSDPRFNTLPVDPACVIAQHSRLGSTGAMLARSFWGPDRISKREQLPDAINAIKNAYEASKSLSSQDARQALLVALHNYS